MSASTTPDSITYPVSTDSFGPLETVFATMAASIQTAFSNTKTYRTADHISLAAITGMASGALADVIEGGAIFAYDGSVWQQKTVATFAGTAARDTAYAKSSSVYLVAGRAQCIITADNSYLIYQGSGSGWRGPWAPGTPFATSSGEINGNVAGSSSAPLYWGASLTVAFPTGRFTITPEVQVTVASNGIAFATVSSITTTGCTIVITRVGSTPGFTEIAKWTAIQMTPSSAVG